MIDIVYTTWIRDIFRLSYLITTHESIVRNARFNDIPHKYHVCIEAESKHLCGLTEFCEAEGIEMHFKHGKPSLASMMNFANTIGEYPYILFMQDDWLMLDTLDIGKCLKYLENDEYWVLRLRDNHINEHTMKIIEPGLHLLDHRPRGYYYSDNPHIKKRGYHEITGPFAEKPNDNGTDSGRCENIMNNLAKKKAKEGHQIIAFEKQYFRHLGSKHTTLQDKVFDR